MRPQVEEGNHGRIVEIDIETGAFEVADEILTAIDRFLQHWLLEEIERGNRVESGGLQALTRCEIGES